MMKQKKITVANVVDYLETLCSTNYVFLNPTMQINKFIGNILWNVTFILLQSLLKIAQYKEE